MQLAAICEDSVKCAPITDYRPPTTKTDSLKNTHESHILARDMCEGGRGNTVTLAGSFE